MSANSLFSFGCTALSMLAKSEVGTGMLLQAARDIFITVFDRDKGFTEIKFANEGDEIEVIGEEMHRPGDLFLVKNSDNHGEFGCVVAEDLEDTFGEYK